MNKFKFTNLAVFIIFFGVALFESIQKGNWVEAIFFIALGVLSLWADSKRSQLSMYSVYLLLCKDKSIYTGITTDVKRRLAEHKAGIGGHYTRARGAAKILHTEQFETRSQASRREAQIKKLTRSQKMLLYTKVDKQPGSNKTEEYN